MAHELDVTYTPPSELIPIVGLGVADTTRNVNRIKKQIHLAIVRGISQAVEATIHLIEPLGSEVIVTLKVGQRTLTAEAFSGWLLDEGFIDVVGKKVWITFESGKLNLFDARSEKSIL